MSVKNSGKLVTADLLFQIIERIKTEDSYSFNLLLLQSRVIPIDKLKNTYTLIFSGDKWILQDLDGDILEQIQIIFPIVIDDASALSYPPVLTGDVSRYRIYNNVSYSRSVKITNLFNNTVQKLNTIQYQYQITANCKYPFAFPASDIYYASCTKEGKGYLDTLIVQEATLSNNKWQKFLFDSYAVRCYFKALCGCYSKKHVNKNPLSRFISHKCYDSNLLTLITNFLTGGDICQLKLNNLNTIHYIYNSRDNYDCLILKEHPVNELLNTEQIANNKYKQHKYVLKLTNDKDYWFNHVGILEIHRTYLKMARDKSINSNIYPTISSYLIQHEWKEPSNYKETSKIFSEPKLDIEAFKTELHKYYVLHRTELTYITNEQHKNDVIASSNNMDY